jgi:hypothetical protein
MFEKVTRSLDTCKRAHYGTRFDEAMKLALNDAFIDLITLWAESAGVMRSSPHGMCSRLLFLHISLTLAKTLGFERNTSLPSRRWTTRSVTSMFAQLQEPAPR